MTDALPDARPLEVICVGRAAVDLYGQQIGGRLEDVQTFAKYLGGSSGNLAAGLARLGRKSAMLTRVGNEQMGRFVREELARQGVDVSWVRTDPSRLTALVILGIAGPDDIPHIFYRERCADMGLVEDDIDEAFVASAKLLAVTGTHLSSDSTRAAIAAAMRFARRHGTRIVLDIDYRPVLWGLGSAGDGANRFVASRDTTATLQAFIADCDLIVGTEEEIAIAGGSSDVLEALQHIRKRSAATIVMKSGADGCKIFESGPIAAIGDAVTAPGLPVEVFNTVGAGDAFLSGFLAGWLDELSWEACGRMGNACGALVVARHGCTPAMPSRIELEAFLNRKTPPRRPRTDVELSHLHRATTWRDEPGPLCVLAFDHRSQFEQLASEHGRPFGDIGEFKGLIATVLADVAESGADQVRHGAIVDYRYGAAALQSLSRRPVWTACPIEVPSSRPLRLDPERATASHLSTWPAARVVKCLVFYHPDDPAPLRHQQEEQIRALHAELVALERRLILEVICPSVDRPVDAGTLPRALRRLYNLGVRPDWWKLAAQSYQGWQAISNVIAECDPHCKGVVMLGLGAEEATIHEALNVAASFDVCRGFAVGRSIFAAAANRWFAGEIDDEAAMAEIRRRYTDMIDTWCRAASHDRATAGQRS